MAGPLSPSCYDIECETDDKLNLENWEPLRNVLQGESNYGSKALFYTRRDDFLWASTKRRVDLGGQNEDKIIFQRRQNLESAKYHEAKALSAAMLAVRRERLRQLLRRDENDDDDSQECRPQHPLPSLVCSLPPLTSLLRR